MKVNAEEYPTSLTSSNVYWKSSSVSTGKPTMISVVKVTPGISSLIFFT